MERPCAGDAFPYGKGSLVLSHVELQVVVRHLSARQVDTRPATWKTEKMSGVICGKSRVDTEQGPGGAQNCGYKVRTQNLSWLCVSMAHGEECEQGECRD